jgi:hypothetical protein
MSKFNAILAIAAASVLLAGNAFAASWQPAAGEAPFADTVVASSLVQRAEVRADAARHLPAAGELNVTAAPVFESDVSRAEVRAATREAIAHGVRPATGEQA